MSDSDDICAWDNQESMDSDGDDGGRGGVISGGFEAGGATKKSSRQSGRNSNAPKYKDASSEEDGGGESDDSDIEVVEEKKQPAKRKGASPKKKAPPSKAKSPRKSPPKVAAAASNKKEETIDSDDIKAAVKSKSSPKKTAAPAPAPLDEGIDVVIPHTLLNKHQGTCKNECTMLVQVESNDDASHHLDFHGQSGAIGRFEADDEGVILDLKGYQYRGTIRPGPTAMIVALTRDGQFKVESIVDEFVTLDTNTKTNVMAKLDAVVKGDMDESYQVREENVNAKNKRGKKAGDNGDGTEEEGGGGSKKGKKKASTAVAAGNSAKKRKTK